MQQSWLLSVEENVASEGTVYNYWFEESLTAIESIIIIILYIEYQRQVEQTTMYTHV